jgi:hypothetical protein
MIIGLRPQASGLRKKASGVRAGVQDSREPICDFGRDLPLPRKLRGAIVEP